MTFLNRKNLILGVILMLALSIPITIRQLQRSQDSRSKAAASTSLSFNPTSSAGTPIQKNVGETIPLDMMVTPGNNLVTFVKFQVSYDPTKLELSTTDPFTINASAFPTKVEGPVVGSGKAAEAVSIGSDPTKAIQAVTKVGTLNFKAIGTTDGTPTTVTFISGTQALSSGANDQASENVVSTTSPATIVIGGNGGTPGPSATPSGTLTPAPTANTTLLTVDLKLHGIGSAGDNPNPGGNTLSNKNPLHPQRNLILYIYDTSNQLVSSMSGSVIYDEQSGDFLTNYDLGANFKEGNYSVKVKTDRYLRKIVPGIQAIKNLRENGLPVTDLVAGDVNDDNVLNVLDYNALLDCGYGQIEPLPMADPNAAFNKQVCQVHKPVANLDVNDNGIIDSTDYNLFVRELSVQNGD